MFERKWIKVFDNMVDSYVYLFEILYLNLFNYFEFVLKYLIFLFYFFSILDNFGIKFINILGLFIDILRFF